MNRSRKWLAIPLLAVLAAGCPSAMDQSRYKRFQDNIASDDAHERSMAAELAALLHPSYARKAVPSLITLLKDDDYWVRTYAASSLSHLSEQDFGPDQLNPDRWSQWWYEEAKGKLPKKGTEDEDQMKLLRAKTANDQGEYSLAGGDPIRALNFFQDALRIEGTNPRYHSNKGLALLAIKDYRSADESFRMAIVMDKHYTNAYLNRGAVHSLQADDLRAVAIGYQEARDAARQANRKEDELAAENELRKVMARVTEEEGEALDSYRRALEADRQGALWSAHQKIGQIYMGREDWEGAVGPLEEAKKIQPKAITVRHNLALTYYGLDQYWRAWNEIRAIEALNGKLEPSFVKRVEDQLRKMGFDPDEARSKKG